MFTRPPELDDETIIASLSAHWSFDVIELTYEPVGYGAHHWSAVDETGDPFTLAVHPFLQGHPAGEHGAFPTAAARLAALDVVAEVHRSSDLAVDIAGTDDLVVPHADEIPTAIDALGAAWDAGPYGELARSHLRQHAAGLRHLLDAYQQPAAQVRQHGNEPVLTHGEPHAGNVFGRRALPPHRLGHRARRSARARPLAPRPWRRVHPRRVPRAHRCPPLPRSRRPLPPLVGPRRDRPVPRRAQEPPPRHDRRGDGVQGLQEYLDPAARWPALVRSTGA